MGQVSRQLGARAPRAKAWVSAETAASEVGTWSETKPGTPPHPPRFGAVEHRGIFGILDGARLPDAGLRGLLARSPEPWG